jgi:hypothetical protein
MSAEAAEAAAGSAGSSSAHSSRDKAFEIFVKRTITSIQKEAWGRSKEVKEIREACQAFLNSLDQTGACLDARPQFFLSCASALSVASLEGLPGGCSVPCQRSCNAPTRHVLLVLAGCTEATLKQVLYPLQLACASNMQVRGCPTGYVCVCGGGAAMPHIDSTFGMRSRQAVGQL